MFDNTNQYGLNLTINNSPLTEYQHQGMTFVEGRTNSNYQISISNNSPERIMAIPSVDGFSVIDGAPAGDDSPGYVLDPFQALSIPGWAVDDETVEIFQFGSSSGSYSSKTNRGKKNVGVVGLMVFRPKPEINHYHQPVNSSGLFGWKDPSTSIMRSSALVGSLAITNNQNLGTGFGDSTKFHTTWTDFEKRDPDHPDALISIFYDDANGLESRGIILHYRNSSPQPFPTYTKYSTPPSGWKR